MLMGSLCRVGRVGHVCANDRGSSRSHPPLKNAERILRRFPESESISAAPPQAVAETGRVNADEATTDTADRRRARNMIETKGRINVPGFDAPAVGLTPKPMRRWRSRLGAGFENTGVFQRPIDMRT
jgi:hypothetical protein